ncbi:MAG: DEAD/DEAH box helicase [Planctomycetota bacterium]
MTFVTLGLDEPILRGVQDAGYEKPTEIQRRTIPLILEGRELIGLGETGSGKTASFGLPMLQKLWRGEHGLRGLVIVPTRELCVQVAESLRAYGAHTGLSICTAFGGIDMSIQESAFKRGLDILVACPGRLIDHLERHNLTLERVSMVVLDEADRMLDMGFMPQIRKIFMRLPSERQNLMFSATMPEEVDALVRDFLPDAERVQVGRRSQSVSTIQHRFVAVNVAQKQRLIEQLLARERGKVLIFVNKKLGAQRLGDSLKRSGLAADSIHGDKGAEQRHVVLQQFSRGKTRFLVATDVAARGIDVDDIELVVNYDFPLAKEDYIHRTGRTGRAGRKGRALSLVAPSERGRHREVVAHLKGEASPSREGGRRRGTRGSSSERGTRGSSFERGRRGRARSSTAS